MVDLKNFFVESTPIWDRNNYIHFQIWNNISFLYFVLDNIVYYELHHYTNNTQQYK